MSAKGYFLPKALGVVLTHECATGITATPANIYYNGFYAAGFTLEGDETDIWRFIREAPIWGSPVHESLATMLRQFDGEREVRSGLDLRGVGRRVG